VEEELSDGNGFLGAYVQIYNIGKAKGRMGVRRLQI
jgi:hypothetical protein